MYSLPFLPGGSDPDRWDVVVFKYPEEPETNYIKRLVGLPNEVLRVYFGDILTRPFDKADASFHFQRRPLEHQESMQILVYDDTHRPAGFSNLPEWQRWQPRSEGAWTEDEETPGTFVSSGKAGAAAELRYQHLVPDPKQWQEILDGTAPSTPPRPTLITDVYSYNSTVQAGRPFDVYDWYQPNWVGDLTLSFRLKALAPQSGQPAGTVTVELIEGGESNRCVLDLATGKATLYHGKQALGDPVATDVNDLAEHEIVFANVDDRLTLWVDGETPFGNGRPYGDAGVHAAPTEADLDPVGIAAEGAKVQVSGLVLKRDIYYTQQPGSSDYNSYPWNPPFRRYGAREMDDAIERVMEIFRRLGDPAQFPELGNLGSRDFPIRPGHYMMMGDNSPRSKDGRQWGQADQMNPDFPEYGWDPNPRESWEVPENLLIGKAFYVYWPHGKPFGPDVRVSQNFRIPFRPYVERMKWIR